MTSGRGGPITAGIGWTVNTADTGLIVNGDNVTAYGLFVEHYQKYQVMWNGENGSTIMFQNEMPYDLQDLRGVTDARQTCYWSFRLSYTRKLALLNNLIRRDSSTGS